MCVDHSSPLEVIIIVKKKNRLHIVVESETIEIKLSQVSLYVEQHIFHHDKEHNKAIAT